MNTFHSLTGGNPGLAPRRRAPVRARPRWLRAFGACTLLLLCLGTTLVAVVWFTPAPFTITVLDTRIQVDDRSELVNDA